MGCSVVDVVDVGHVVGFVDAIESKDRQKVVSVVDYDVNT